MAAAGSLIDILLDSLGPLAPGVAGGLGVASPHFVGFLEGAGAEMGGGGPAFGAPFGWEPPGAVPCCIAAFAARCRSGSSLLSALVIFFCDLAGGWVDGPSAEGPFEGWVGSTGAGITDRT